MTPFGTGAVRASLCELKEHALKGVTVMSWSNDPIHIMANPVRLIANSDDDPGIGPPNLEGPMSLEDDRDQWKRLALSITSILVLSGQRLMYRKSYLMFMVSFILAIIGFAVILTLIVVDFIPLIPGVVALIYNFLYTKELFINQGAFDGFYPSTTP